MRSKVVAATVVFAVALALRLATIAALQDDALFRTPQLDALEYVEWGSRLAKGDFSWPAAPIHGPGYPMFIALVLAATKSLLAVRIVQAILAAFAAVLITAIGGRLYGTFAGAAAGVLHATYAPLVLIDVSLLAEGLFVFLLVTTLWLVLKISLGDFPRPHLFLVAAGLLLGLATIVRPTAAALIPLFALFALRGVARRSAGLLIFAIAVATPVVPVIVQNRMTPDRLPAVQASGGMNAYIGNSPLHDGTAWARPGGKWDAMRGMAWRAGVRGAAAEDRFFLTATASEIAAQPLAYARLLLSKFAWLIQNEEVRDTHSFHFFAAAAPMLRWLPGFAVVFALSACGIAAALRTHRATWLIVGYTLIMAATVVGLVVGYRYRIPMMPALFVLAGVGVARAAQLVALRHDRMVAALAIVFAIAFAAAHTRLHEPSHDFSEELAMTAIALQKEGRVTEAIHAARRAVAMNPSQSAAWTALGDVEAMRGRWDAAEHAWRQALVADPNTSRAWSHLALAYIRRDERAKAEEALRRALAIRADEEAAVNLQTLLGTQ